MQGQLRCLVDFLRFVEIFTFFLPLTQMCETISFIAKLLALTLPEKATIRWMVNSWQSLFFFLELRLTKCLLLGRRKKNNITLVTSQQSDSVPLEMKKT